MPSTESIVLGMNKRKIFLDEDYLLLETAPFWNIIDPVSLTHYLFSVFF